MMNIFSLNLFFSFSIFYFFGHILQEKRKFKSFYKVKNVIEANDAVEMVHSFKPNFMFNGFDLYKVRSFAILVSK